MKHPLISLFCILQSATLLVGCGKKETSRPSGKPAAPAIESEQVPGDATSPKLSDSNLRPVREPKHHPTPVIPPDSVNPIGDRLSAAITRFQPKSKEYSDSIHRLWREDMEKISANVLPSSSKLEINRGIILPDEFSSLKRLDFTKDTPEGALAFIALATIATGRDDLLFEIAKQRTNELPPTNLDLAIFQALDTAIKEIRHDSLMIQFEKWKELSTSNNPLYRLLALRAAWRSTAKEAIGLSDEDKSYNRVNGAPKLGFYLSYLDERDPIILAEAITAVATVPTLEARQAIEKFQAVQQQRGDAVLVQAAAAALRTQELIFQGSR